MGKLETIIATYTSLPAFAWHVGKSLLVNGVEIYHDIDSAITDYRASNWEKFGEDIGDASAKVFLGAEELIKFIPEDIGNNAFPSHSRSLAQGNCRHGFVKSVPCCTD